LEGTSACTTIPKSGDKGHPIVRFEPSIGAHICQNWAEYQLKITHYPFLLICEYQAGKLAKAVASSSTTLSEKNMSAELDAGCTALTLGGFAKRRCFAVRMVLAVPLGAACSMSWFNNNLQHRHAQGISRDGPNEFF